MLRREGWGGREGREERVRSPSVSEGSESEKGRIRSVLLNNDE